VSQGPHSKITVPWTVVGTSKLSIPNRRLGFYQGAETDQNTFVVISLWGKFGGLHACAATFPYIVPLPDIFSSRLFSKLRLKRKDFRKILRLIWAQEVPSSNLGAPTKTSRVLSVAYRNLSSLKAHLWNSGRQEVWIRKSSSSQGFATCRTCENTRRQECYSETIERRLVKRAPSGKYGENHGDRVHFSSHQSEEMQVGDHALGSARASQCLSICVLNRRVKNRQEKSTSVSNRND